MFQGRSRRQQCAGVSSGATQGVDNFVPTTRKAAEALAAVTARRDALLAEERQLAAAVAEAERQAQQLAADRAHEESQRSEAQAFEARLDEEAAALAEDAARHPELITS